MNNIFSIMTEAEIAVLDYIQKFTNPVFDAVMPFLSALCAHGEIWIAAALIMLCFAKTRRTGMAVAFALIFGLVSCNMVLKPLVARIRPYEFTDIQLIVARLDDYSFPSGHTIASFEAAGAMLFTRSKFTVPAFVLAVLIAFSRLYLYVHFPTDVITSIVLGIIFAFLATKLADFIISKAPGIIKEKK